MRYEFEGNVFTDEQSLFLDKAREGCDVLVDACIGSGKTTAIQAACGVLSKMGKKVLYLTYNRRLLEEARRRIDPKDADVETYHSFGGRMLGAAKIPAASERDVPVRFLKLTKIPKYDTVVVDEYQDLAEDLKGMLWHIVRLSVNTYGFAPQFLIVGDKDQKILDNTEVDAPAAVAELLSFVAHVHGKDYYAMEFTNCFRLNAQWAQRLGNAWKKSIIGLNSGCEVTDTTVSNCVLMLSKLEPKDILVLGSNMAWGDRVTLQNKLEERWPKKFNRNTVYSSITDHDTDRRALDTSDCAVFTTYDSAKGMERKVCVVCDFNGKYLEARMKHQTSRKVLKNLFLVAASRGKEKIIFIRPHAGSALLTPEDVARVSGTPPIPMGAEFVSEMYAFKRREAVDRCLSFVETDCIQQAGNEIGFTRSAGQIDLSLCAGLHAQAVYFDGYDIESAITYAWDRRVAKGNFPRQLPPPKRSWPLWRKILYLAALETGQARYFTQVKEPYISDEMSDKLCMRLSERLPSDACSEQTVKALFKHCVNPETGWVVGDKTVTGRMDVVKGGMPWELKFVASLKAEHILQAAMYAVCCGSEDAALWNLRTDELVRVSVPDPAAFLDATLRCVTNGVLVPGVVTVYGNLDTGMSDRLTYTYDDTIRKGVIA